MLKERFGVGPIELVLWIIFIPIYLLGVLVKVLLECA